MTDMTPADVAAVTNHGYGYGCGNGCNGWGNNGMFGMEWIFALLILPMLWGGNGPFGRSGNDGNFVTEADLCNANSFSELKGSVGRLNDQVNGVNTNLGNAVCNLGYETLRNFNALEQLVSNCCCETKQIALENRYLAAQNTSAINATTVAENQKVLDAICGLRLEMKDTQNAQLLQRVNQLEMQSAIDRATCGIVRYPTSTTYGAGNPFFNGFGCGCNRGGCCNNNI